MNAVVSPQAVPFAPSNLMEVITRAAADPNVDVVKIEKLLDMYQRIEAHRAEMEFNAAMAACQEEMRPISADATNPQTRSKYASYQKLDAALRPIYTKHGFSISYSDAETPKAEHVRVVALVRHKAGFRETHWKDMPADGKGAKGGDVMTKTHAAGSAQSYGSRYLLKGIFNVAVGEEDNDGNGVPKFEPPKAPEGYENWKADMNAVAEEGKARHLAAWKASKPAFRAYAATHDGFWWDASKKKAAKVGE